MLPFRLGVYAEVAPIRPAWRDLARVAEGPGYSTLSFLITLTPTAGAHTMCERE